MKVSLDALSHFAVSMARCLASGLPTVKALELSTGRGSPPRLRRAVTAAAARCGRGVPVSEALEPEANCFPDFFLPVVRAGELGGRQVEAYELVHEHCERLKPTMRLVRNAWLYPLICIGTGWVVRIGLFLYFGFGHAAWRLFQDTVVTVLLGVGFVTLALKLPPVREAVDWLLLQIPFVRTTIIRVGLVLFFSTFRLVYETGGLAVREMLNLALATVSNRVLRRDLSAAGPVLEENGAFGDAFAEPALLDDWIKSSIATGAISGHLGTSLAQVVKTETIDLELTLELFNRIFQRLVAYSVTLSIVGTLLVCLTAPGP